MATLIALIAATSCTHSPGRHLESDPVPALLAPTATALADPTTTSTVRPPEHASRRRSRAVGTALPPTAATGDLLDRIARCESGGNPRAVGGRGRFFGAWQFMLSTFHSVGGVGNPIDYSYDEQKVYAARLLARSGIGQWPICGRRAAA